MFLKIRILDIIFKISHKKTTFSLKELYEIKGYVQIQHRYIDFHIMLKINKIFNKPYLKYLQFHLHQIL